MSTAITRPPAIAAYWIARWPRPPTPKTATRSDERVPATLTALYVVTPAHVSGAASNGIDPVGHLDDVAAEGHGVLAEAAVDRVAHVLLLEAERLPTRDAVLTGAAGVAQPRHRDAVADRDLGLTRAELDDDPDALVPGHERRRRLDRPVAVRRVDVGVAETRRLDPHPHLAGGELGRRDLLDAQRRCGNRGPPRPGRPAGSARSQRPAARCSCVQRCWSTCWMSSLTVVGRPWARATWTHAGVRAVSGAAQTGMTARRRRPRRRRRLGSSRSALGLHHAAREAWITEPQGFGPTRSSRRRGASRPGVAEPSGCSGASARRRMGSAPDPCVLAWTVRSTRPRRPSVRAGRHRSPGVKAKLIERTTAEPDSRRRRQSSTALPSNSRGDRGTGAPGSARRPQQHTAEHDLLHLVAADPAPARGRRGRRARPAPSRSTRHRPAATRHGADRTLRSHVLRRRAAS